MLTVNLEKKMIAGKKLEKQQALILQEAENLLNNIPKEDMYTLVSLGLTKNIEKGQAIKAKQDALSIYENEHLFHISEIEKICKNYLLRFLPSFYYKGAIDPLLAPKVKVFEEKYKKYLRNERNYYSKENRHYDGSYYICAPKSSFVLQEKPKDPLFFAQVADEYYVLIHKWGNDISLKRRIMGFVFYNTGFFTFITITFFWSTLLYFYDCKDIPGELFSILLLASLAGFFVALMSSVQNENVWKDQFKD